MSTVQVTDVHADAHNAGFDDVDLYRTWLLLEGRRQLSLILREKGDRQRQVLDRDSELHEPVGLVRAGTAERCSRVVRGIGRNLRVLHRVSAYLLTHCLAPSSLAGEGSVAASPTDQVTVGDAGPDGST